MAAGLGFKDFTTGEVLTAADVDGYLMQGVWVFASAAARDAAVTSPQEGNFAYLKDTNVTTYYTGSAWANLDTTGMTNPMTTTGDIIYSSPGSTPVRLGIGSTGNVLTVAGGVPSWAAPAGGGKVLQVVQATNTTATTVSGTTFTDTSLSLAITPTSASSKILVMINQAYTLLPSPTGGNGHAIKIFRDATEVYATNSDYTAGYVLGSISEAAAFFSVNYLDSPATTSSTTYKTQGRRSDNGSVVYQRSSGQSVITLMEIGA